jgi:predicted PurR-regulated permease PerM
MTMPKYTAHVFFILVLVAVGWFGLSSLLLSVLFSYFALDQLRILKRKWLTLFVFCIVVAIICSGLAYMGSQAYKHLPQAIQTAIPTVTQYAQDHHLDLPFTDWDTLKSYSLDTVKEQAHYLGSFGKLASKQFILILIGIVTALSLFLNPNPDLDSGQYKIKNNLYSVFWRDFAVQFQSFYRSFKTVMRAQLIISTINTGLTAIFITAVSMPYAIMLVVITFLCGLLPIVGNLISNSVIVAIGFSISPHMGLSALVFLVILHKLEYFLNSKIIGEQIKNPVWLTLIGLIVGERILGIAGMILAPVILYYIKCEATQMETTTPAPQPQSPEKSA